MWSIIKTLLRLAPNAIDSTREAVCAIRAGNRDKAAMAAIEAAERQALFLRGRKRLKG